jgi:alcohol dehydrogenase
LVDQRLLLSTTNQPLSETSEMAIYIGHNSFLQLIKIVKREASVQIFLVTGKSSFDRSPAKDIILKNIKKTNISRFSDFSPNVKIEEAIEGCRRFHAVGAETILAVGGGSVIDMAKIISAGARDKKNLLQIIKGQRDIESNTKLYCAPTTAGSGSEATHFAVVYIDGQKHSFDHEKLLPKSVAVDPSLSSSMPPYLTACSGFDALSQAIEAYWSKSSNPTSRKLSEQSIALLLPNICDAVHSPNAKTRAMMAEGSHLAGKAINISKTTAPHALSYYLTSKFSIAHGHAVALLLGHFFLINEKKSPNELYSILGLTSARECCDFWYDLMRQCALETNLARLGVTQRYAQEMALSVNVERLNNNPVFLSKADLVDTINRLFLSD